jgi:hypothetical protein
MHFSPSSEFAAKGLVSFLSALARARENIGFVIVGVISEKRWWNVREAR